MPAYMRLLDYVKVNTQSADGTGVTPSTECQWNLVRQLEREMKELGLQEVRISNFGVVMGTLPATPGCETAPALGFIAHMDTAPAFAGKDVNPILHPDYDGKDVILPEHGSFINFPFISNMFIFDILSCPIEMRVLEIYFAK